MLVPDDWGLSALSSIAMISTMWPDMILHLCGCRYDFIVWFYFDGKVHNVSLHSIFLEDYRSISTGNKDIKD